MPFIPRCGSYSFRLLIWSGLGTAVCNFMLSWLGDVRRPDTKNGASTAVIPSMFAFDTPPWGSVADCASCSVDLPYFQLAIIYNGGKFIGFANFRGRSWTDSNTMDISYITTHAPRKQIFDGGESARLVAFLLVTTRRVKGTWRAPTKKL